MSVILKRYKNIITKFPILSQAVQTGILMGCGDLIAQTLVEKKKLSKIELSRTVRFTIIGTIFVGPPLRFWYVFLDKQIGNKGEVIALKKVAADQLVFSPPFLAIIMTIVDLAKGNSFNGTKERLKHDYFDILKSNYKLWPVVQLCNFYFVQLQHQVLTVQIVAVFWNTYLSWKMNQEIPVR